VILVRVVGKEVIEMSVPDDKEPKYTECQMQFQQACNLLLETWKILACFVNPVAPDLAPRIEAFLEPFGYKFGKRADQKKEG